MESTYRTLNYVQTELLTWGDPFHCSGSDVIICITGNPGVPDFYIEFGSVLHETTSLPVCIIGHAGHVAVPDKQSNTLENNEQLFNLQGQIAHKLDLISNHIDKNSKIHLIGHSIGAWMIVEVLNNINIAKVSSVNLLFPTLQRMAESKNGVFLNNFVRKVNFLILLFASLVTLIPENIRSFLIGLYLKVKSLPKHYIERILKFFHPKVVEKVLFLAYDEMDTVTVLNTTALDKIKHITNVMYSNRDGWVPIQYMDDLKIFQPQLQMKKVNCDHSFVLKSSEEIAESVADFIKPRIHYNQRADKTM